MCLSYCYFKLSFIWAAIMNVKQEKSLSTVEMFFLIIISFLT